MEMEKKIKTEIIQINGVDVECDVWRIGSTAYFVLDTDYEIVERENLDDRFEPVYKNPWPANHSVACWDNNGVVYIHINRSVVLNTWDNILALTSKEAMNCTSDEPNDWLDLEKRGLVERIK